MKIIEKLKNKIFCNDATKLLALLPDKSIDLVLTDPCYGIDYTGQLKRKLGGKKLAITKYSWNDYGASNSEWDKDRTSPQLLKELVRVSKNQIIWGGNYFADILPASQGWLVWNKGQRKFSLADGELAYTSFDKALRIFDYSRSQFKTDEKNRIHATQKPVKLFEWCIMQARLKPGAVVLDPFCGSATLAEACINLGYNYICNDIDAEMIAKARYRIEQRKRQRGLFKAEEVIAYNLSVFDTPPFIRNKRGLETMNKPKAIICDIDGCVLDSSAVHAEIERYSLEGARKWLFFESFANNSKLVKFNRILGDWLYKQSKKGVAIIFLTARSEKIRHTTRLRLTSEFKPDFEFELLMRAKDDLDPAHVCKEKHMKEILATYDVVLAIDDEQANLDMFNSYGLLVKKP